MISIQSIVLAALLLAPGALAVDTYTDSTIPCQVDSDCFGTTSATATDRGATCAAVIDVTTAALGAPKSLFCNTLTKKCAFDLVAGSVTPFRAAGAACGGPCEVPGTCPGGSGIGAYVCSSTTLQSNNFVCNRDADPITGTLSPAGTGVGLCTQEYFCNGTTWCSQQPLTGTPPTTTSTYVTTNVKAKGSVCRAALTTCDAPDVCDGTNDYCPSSSAFANSSTVCRDAAGVCDVAEFCLGNSTTCPADTFKSNATVCRNSTGVCDPAETCTGSNATCPTDAFASATTVCANASGICFNTSLCNGNSSACVARPLANTTACGNSTNPATCNGAGTCSLTCLAKQTACSKTTPPCCARCDGTKYVCRKNSAGDKLCLACVKTGNKCKKTKDCCTGTCKNGKCA